MERRLIERAKSGDLDAYDDLVGRYQGLAFRAAWLTLGDVEEAEDAVQEAFVKAYLNLNRFDDTMTLRPWLLRIVTNEALNAHRTSRRQSALRSRFDQLSTERNEPDQPEDLAIAGETRERLIQALNRLSARDRALLAYRYFLDLSPGEIAEIWESPPSTVRTQLARALTKLRDQLDPESHAPARRREVSEEPS